MKLQDQASKICIELSEEKNGVRLFDSSTNKSHYFKEIPEALWFSIDTVRTTMFDHLTEQTLIDLSKHLNASVAVTKTLLQTIKRERTNRAFYDQVFMKLLTYFRTGVGDIPIASTNFSINLEVIHLLKKHLGIKATMNPIAV